MTNTTSFIETQFPVSKISKESYKERKAGSGQTLTGLGKWWGRKPLILVRATILGLLMPTSDDPKKDQDIFLKLLTMDNEGFLLRQFKNPSLKDTYEYLTEEERKKYFTENGGKNKFNSSLSRDEQNELKDMVFQRMSYDEKLTYCKRPEEVTLNNPDAWKEINSHLETSSKTFDELIQELAKKRFGRNAKVGDCFSGGGSIPFEAARIGCDTYGSDLNPVANLLTWASLNILFSNKNKSKQLEDFLESAFDDLWKFIDENELELNEEGWRGKYYLYCGETKCMECDWSIPLSPSWVIDKASSCIAIIEKNEENKNFDIHVQEGVSKEKLKVANNGTVSNGNITCPHCNNSFPITVLRGDRKVDGKRQYGLRKWNQNEFLPKDSDIFKERLYCIKYIEKYPDKNWEEFIKKPGPATDSTYGTVHYCAPDSNDLKREQKVIDILSSHFDEWQEKGYIPSSKINPGDKTDEPIRTRGWQYWHHLFNPRQLLVLGYLMKLIDEKSKSTDEAVMGMLGINKTSDWNSKLCIWNNGRGVVQATFTNQALNTLYNYASRSLSSIYPVWRMSLNFQEKNSGFSAKTKVSDARVLDETCDYWITDPPYADAINYHELSEFFLAWDKALLKKAFPEWYTDSKRALAVQGDGEDFRNSMVEVYSNLAKHMSDNGRQVVMFTHQDPAVWAELTTILWAAGLQVTAAWNIATETSSGGLKSGNYVQGTVIMVLRKQQSDTVGYLDEVAPLIEEEVKNQIQTMRDLDDKDDPNFTDADYLLAAYAASLKVLTSYKEFKEINLQHELNRSSDTKEKSEIQKIIEEAVKTAYDQLIPRDFDTFAWKSLKPIERFYIRGLELEKEGINKMSAYQELARGFGISNYTELMASTTANQARLKTPTEFGDRMLGDTNDFGKTLLRHVLKALEVAIKEEEPAAGKQWLKTEVTDYWPQRAQIMTLLRYLSTLESYEALSHWSEALEQTTFVRALVEQDGV